MQVRRTHVHNFERFDVRFVRSGWGDAWEVSVEVLVELETCSMCLVFDHRRPWCGEWLSRLRDRIPFPVVLEKSSSRRGHVWFLFVFPYFFAMGDLVTGSSVLVSRSFSRARIEQLRKCGM